MNTNIQNRFNKAFTQLVSKAQNTQEYDARLGSSEGELWSDRTRSMVWARIDLPTGIVEREVYCRKIMPVLNLPVTIKKHRKGFWEVIEEDPLQASTFWGGSTVNANVGIHGASHLYGSLDPTLIDGRQWMHGRVYPTDTLGLSVNINGAFYRHEGIWKYIPSDTIDMTALIPESSNFQRIIIVGVDKSTGTWDTVNGEAQFAYITGSIPFDGNDIVSALENADQNFEPIAAVRLYGGQTAIRQYDIFSAVRSVSSDTGASSFPTRVTLWHDEATVTSGNALSLSLGTSQYYNGAYFQNTDADGDTFTQTFILLEGTYDFYVFGRTGPGLGKIDWYVDEEKVVDAQDWYAGSIGYNVTKATTDIEIIGSGRHVLKGVVNGKNSSSTGYAIYLNKYWFKQTTDS